MTNRAEYAEKVQLIKLLWFIVSRTLFTVDLKGKNLPKGFYNIVLNAKSSKNDKTLILQPTAAQVIAVPLML